MLSDSEDDKDFGQIYQFSPKNREKLEEIRKRLSNCQLSERSCDSVWRSLYHRGISNNNNDADECSSRQITENGNLFVDEYVDIMPTQLLPDIELGESQTISQSSECDMEVDDELSESADVILRQVFEAITSDNNSISTDLMHKFVKISASDLNNNVAPFNYEDADDSTFLRLCKEVTNFDEQLSLIWCIAFVKCFIFKRVIAQNCIPSRFFTAAIADFAKKYSRSIIEGMMVPCLTNDACGRIQITILRQLFNDSLLQEHQTMFLKKLLEQNFSWNESITIFFSGCIESKSELVVDEILDLLIARLIDCCHNLDSNLTFSKFLNSIVNKFGSRLKESHVNRLTTVVMRNKTMLKKGCLIKLQSLACS
ncbi:hypothetical protein CHUAL_012261 [Chamberlinius hualienensis]